MAILQPQIDLDQMVEDMAPITLVGGRLTEQTATSVSNTLRALIRKMNGLISHGTGVHAHHGNIDECHADIIFPSTPDTEVPVPHTLKRPAAAVTMVRADRACRIYDSSPGSWDEKILFLKCDTANAQVRVRID